MVVAQNNVQLYLQVSALGWDPKALVLIKNAYTLALKLFGSQVRASGKQFVCHLVGCASLVARHFDDPTLTAAALLHSAYEHGDFGSMIRGAALRGRRKLMVNRVATEVETLVHQYLTRPWTLESINRLISSAPHSDARFIQLRLANELEDHLDANLLFGGDDGKTTQRSAMLMKCRELARLQGCVGLAAEMGQLLDAPSAVISPVLRAKGHRSYTVRRIGHRTTLSDIVFDHSSALAPLTRRMFDEP